MNVNIRPWLSDPTSPTCFARAHASTLHQCVRTWTRARTTLTPMSHVLFLEPRGFRVVGFFNTTSCLADLQRRRFGDIGSHS